MTQDEIIDELLDVVANNQQFTTWTVSTPHLVELVNRAINRELEKKQPEQENIESVPLQKMKEWVAYLKFKSDYAQHMKISAEISAGTCWELATELEQFIELTEQL
jgi:ribosomal protein L11